MTSGFIVVLLNLACLSALFWFFDYPYRRYRVDLLRFHLFGARDELFRLAETGEISFSDSAYGMTRQTLNGMIRFAHEISLWRLLVISFASKYWGNAVSVNDYLRRREAALQSLTKHQHRIIAEAMNSAHVALASHVLHTSLISFPFVMLLKLCVYAHGAFKNGFAEADKSMPAPMVQAVDREAYFYADEDQRCAA